MRKPTPEDLADEFALANANFMQQVFKRYEGQEVMVADTLLRSFGAYVSIVAAKPQEALEDFAEMLKRTDHATIRAAHFGYKLGTAQGVVQPAKAGELIMLGDHRGKPN